MAQFNRHVQELECRRTLVSELAISVSLIALFCSAWCLSVHIESSPEKNAHCIGAAAAKLALNQLKTVTLVGGGPLLECELGQCPPDPTSQVLLRIDQPLHA